MRRGKSLLDRVLEVVGLGGAAKPWRPQPRRLYAEPLESRQLLSASASLPVAHSAPTPPHIAKPAAIVAPIVHGAAPKAAGQPVVNRAAATAVIAAPVAHALALPTLPARPLPQPVRAAIHAPVPDALMGHPKPMPDRWKVYDNDGAQPIGEIMMSEPDELNPVLGFYYFNPEGDRILLHGTPQDPDSVFVPDGYTRATGPRYKLPRTVYGAGMDATWTVTDKGAEDDNKGFYFAQYQCVIQLDRGVKTTAGGWTGKWGADCSESEIADPVRPYNYPEQKIKGSSATMHDAPGPNFDFADSNVIPTKVPGGTRWSLKAGLNLNDLGMHSFRYLAGVTTKFEFHTYLIRPQSKGADGKVVKGKVFGYISWGVTVDTNNTHPVVKIARPGWTAGKVGREFKPIKWK